jgi:hypothetical protein
VKDYKAIFEAVESSLFDAGSGRVPREQIAASLESSKHLEGRRFADDECYTKRVHIVFYSGFKAEIVTKKRPIIDEAVQVAAAQKFTFEMAEKGRASADELLDSLRSNLRKELDLARVDGKLAFLRIVFEKDQKK